MLADDLVVRVTSSLVHEIAIMQGVVDQVRDRLGDRRVSTVQLSIGKLSGVVPDALRFCFELVTSGTTMDGADLQIDEPEGRAQCRSCGIEFGLDAPILLCRCGSANVHIVSGDQLLIRAVRVA